MPQQNLRVVFLNPGDYWFGDSNIRIQTILGSCISITLWHPRLCIGGMCHFVLPTRTNSSITQKRGTYASDVMELFTESARKHSTRLQEYQVKLFGGGNMFPALQHHNGGMDVSRKNIEFAQELLQQYKLPLAAHCLGGIGHRKLTFDIASGDVWVKRSDLKCKIADHAAGYR